MRNPPGVVLGAFLLLSGIILAIKPYELVKVSEQVDSIGSKRSWHAIEPANWTVTLDRHGG